MDRREEIIELIKTNPGNVADMLVAWEVELSKVMPDDFKDWWENDKSEWPIVARLVIEGVQKREKIYKNSYNEMKDLFLTSIRRME